ncbi:hypothetical protein ACKI1J_36150 [Streptomyces scabiei]|uniref:hypothetical protein n=1 Tax=Streptomyces scabiei TaxID=1930 RepID=UPI0038F5FBF2
MTMSAPRQPTRRDAPEDRAAPPRADCVADFAGGLTFDLADPGVTGAAHLVLHRRGGDHRTRLPLTPAGHGRLRTALPTGTDLPEGRWDVYLQVAGDEPHRLAPGLNDLRSLVDRAPAPAAGRVAVRIPYGTKHGNLSVRSWERSPHAEAGALHIGEGGLEVIVRVYGAAPTPEAYAELTDRAEGSPAVRAALVPDDRGDLRFTLPYGGLRPGTWNLWLCPRGESGPRARVARLLDDIVEKASVLVYPGRRVETGHGPVEVAPFYTADNDLSVTVAAVS